MELDFIDISKADEEERVRAAKTSKSNGTINKSVFLDINEESGGNAVYADRSAVGTAVGGGAPIRTTVRNPGRTVVNIDISRKPDRERTRTDRNRAGNAQRSKSRAESRRRGGDVADRSVYKRTGRSNRREGYSGGRRRESYEQDRDADYDRERTPERARRRNPQRNAEARRRAAEEKAQREREQRRRRRRRQQIAAKFTVLVFMTAFAGTLLLFFTKLIKGEPESVETVRRIENTFTDNTDRKEVIQTNKTQKPIMEENFLTVNEYSRPGDKLEKVNNIFVHYTANKGTSAAQNRSYFENLGITGETSASAHFIVGFDGEIVQCIPLEEIAYAVQKRNYDSISIECCYLQDNGKFTEETYQSLIRLCAWLLNEYNLAPEDMRRHYDEGGKKCPLYYVEHEDAWEQFLKDLRDYIMAGKTGEV